MAQAQRDLEKAQVDLQHAYWEWACFTAQQAAEKGVKAWLMRRGYSVRGHSITSLLRAGREEKLVFPDHFIELAQLLDGYYIPTRYPNGFPEGKPADYYSLAQAERAIDAAREILRYCQDQLD
jgi:HEPN domain-containing protein